MIENTQKIHFQKLLYLKWLFLCLEDFSKSVKFVFNILKVSALPSPATIQKGETAEIQRIFFAIFDMGVYAGEYGQKS